MEHYIPGRAIAWERLALSERSVAESENFVRRQRELMAGVEADSLATIIAKVVLSELEETLARQTADRDRLRAALREGPPN
jgi:hypothetical protein